MQYKVKDITGDYAITLEDGQILFDRIHPELATGHQVQLDFEGVSVFASPFFNAAVGQLLKDLTPDTLNTLLKVVNLSPVGLDVLKRVIENAKRYYSSPDYRKAQEQLLQKLSEEP